MSKFICTTCGGDLTANTDRLLPSSPPKYEATCSKGHVDYIDCQSYNIQIEEQRRAIHMENQKIVKVINSWDDLKTAEDFFQAMVHFEYEAGEDFIDQNESFLSFYPFLQWLRGKGVVSNDLCNKILSNKEPLKVSLQYFLSSYDNNCSLFPFGETDDEAHYKGFQLMAEYCVGIKSLQKRMCNDVLHQYDYRFHEDEEKEDISKLEHYWSITKERWDSSHELWVKIQKVTVEHINDRLEKEENS